MVPVRRSFGQQRGSVWRSRSPARPLRQKGREGSAGGARGGTCRRSIRTAGGGSAPASLHTRHTGNTHHAVTVGTNFTARLGAPFPTEKRSLLQGEAGVWDGLPAASSGRKRSRSRRRPSRSRPVGTQHCSAQSPTKHGGRKARGPHHAPSALTVT